MQPLEKQQIYLVKFDTSFLIIENFSDIDVFMVVFAKKAIC